MNQSRLISWSIHGISEIVVLPHPIGYTVLALISALASIGVTRIYRWIHEGLHALTAHRLGLRGEIHGANTYVHRAPKRAWLVIALAPSVFPLLVFLGLAWYDGMAALGLALVLLAGSAADALDTVLVLKTPGRFVSDTADGLFVFD